MAIIPDSNIVIPRLYDFFPEDQFNISINEKDPRLININSKNGSLCTEFHFEHDNNEIVLHIDFLSKCSSNGKTNLEKLIQYARINKLNIKLLDASSIFYDFINESKESDMENVSISLRKLKLLQTGKTWYQQFGFTNPEMESYKESITKFINSEFKFILEMPEFLKYKSLITFFYRRNHSILNMTIKEFFIFTENILKILCPNSTCIIKLKPVIKFYSRFINDIYELMKNINYLDKIDKSTKFMLSTKGKRVKNKKSNKRRCK